jgi:hypothetical protein
MNEIINSSTLRQGSAPWNTEIVSFNQNVKLDLWGQSANDILKIRRVRVQEGAIIHTNNQTCCIITATKAQVKASKVVLRCDCDGSRPAELTTDVTSIILSAGAYVFEYSGNGFAAKTTVLTYEESKKEACDCACAQAPCLPVSITTLATGETSANVTIVSGSDAYGREVTVKLFNGANEYEQVGVNGDVLTFAGLQPSTTYSVVATNDCSEKDTSQVTTATSPPCPTLALTAAATGTNSIVVTLISGGSAWIELNGEKRYVANGGIATFNDLTPSKEYFAVGTSDCGSIANVSATTQACPAISLTQTSNTTGSITVTLVSGGIASVFVGGDEAIFANGASYTFTNLTAGKNYTAKVISECGNKANFTIATAPCPAVDFTALALSTTSLQVTAVAGMPLTISVVSQGGAVLDSVDGVSSTVVFTDLPEGAIVTVKAVNECGKTKQLNVNLPDPTPVAEPFCASLNLKDESPKFAGFAYFPEDSIDPAATVPFRGGFIYPTRGKGHTVKVEVAGVVIGYAANKSDCANPCCEPVSNKTSVGGTSINDETNKYWIGGEIKKCVNGVVVDAVAGDVFQIAACPTSLIPIPPLDDTPCASPEFILGESADGTVRKYQRSASKIVTPQSGSVEANSLTETIGSPCPSLDQTLTIQNPSLCLPAVALIEYTNSFQIDNKDFVIRDIVEIDKGGGIYQVQVSYQHPYLKGAPLGMSQVYTYDVSRTVFSVPIPAGGSITIGSKMRTEVQLAGTVAPVFEAAFSHLNAIVYVDQVI